jgi:glycosyltransferase involved in cell wall biosynthesis
MADPLVSIIIPVYNGSNYLREAIDSALAQTYANCEVIVVNDGSADDTESICLSYGSDIRYYSKENGGVATALNLAIEKMRGEYFSWLSHDDVYYPRKVEAQIEALKRDGDMRKVVLGDYDSLNQNTGRKTPSILSKMDDERLFTDSVYPVIRGLIGGCALLIHRSHFERVGVFDTKMRYVQDYDLWFRILHKQKSLYVNELMYTVRSHDKQDGRTKALQFHKEEISLWKGYEGRLTDKEMSEIYGSKFFFLLEMWLRILLYGCDDDDLREKLCHDGELEHAAKKLKAALDSVSAGKDLSFSIFGAGPWGLSTYHLLRFFGLEVSFFIDNNPQKQNTEIIDGVLCRSFADTISSRDDVLVIVTVQALAEVLSQLGNAGFQHVITKQRLEKMLWDRE